MDSIQTHNSALQTNGRFNVADLEANRKGQLSPAQLKQFEERRDFIKADVPKYNNTGWIISLVFGIGACLFAGVLYFVGVFDILQESLGVLFYPVLCVAGGVVALFVFVVIPRQYKSSVEMYQSMGKSLQEGPIGNVQVFEAHAQAYESQRGINRRGSQSRKITYILEIKDIKFIVSELLMQTIQSERLYRAYAVQENEFWHLLSIEAIE